MNNRTDLEKKQCPFNLSVNSNPYDLPWYKISRWYHANENRATRGKWVNSDVAGMKVTLWYQVSYIPLTRPCTIDLIPRNEQKLQNKQQKQ